MRDCDLTRLMLKIASRQGDNVGPDHSIRATPQDNPLGLTQIYHLEECGLKGEWTVHGRDERSMLCIRISR